MKRGSGIEIRCHPSERRRARSVVAASCSCTCCCCLHSLAGVAAAAIVSARIVRKAPDAVEDPTRLEERRRTLWPVFLYWKCFGIALTLEVIIIYALANEGAPPAETAFLVALLSFIFLPAPLLVAAILASLRIRMRLEVEEEQARRELGTVWRIGGWSFLASLVGAFLTYFWAVAWYG